MAAGVERHQKAHRRDWGLDVRLSLALARSPSSRDYIQAQRIRTRTIAHFESAFSADALPDGESDLTTTLESMRFSTPPNLTGHPAISIPAGYDAGGLPVGLQAIGRYWHEHTLLRLPGVGLEVICPIGSRRRALPGVWSRR